MKVKTSSTETAININFSRKLGQRNDLYPPKNYFKKNKIKLGLLAHSHWRIRTRIPTRTRIPVLYKY